MAAAAAMLWHGHPTEVVVRISIGCETESCELLIAYELFTCCLLYLLEKELVHQSLQLHYIVASEGSIVRAFHCNLIAQKRDIKWICIENRISKLTVISQEMQESFRLQLVLNIYFIHIAKVITVDAAKFNLNLRLLLCKPSPVFAIRP